MCHCRHSKDSETADKWFHWWHVTVSPFENWKTFQEGISWKETLRQTEKHAKLITQVKCCNPTLSEMFMQKLKNYALGDVNPPANHWNYTQVLYLIKSVFLQQITALWWYLGRWTLNGIRAILLTHCVLDLPVYDYTGQWMEEERVAYEEGGIGGQVMGTDDSARGDVQMHRLAYTTVPCNPPRKWSISSIYDCSIFAVLVPFVCAWRAWLWSLGISPQTNTFKGIPCGKPAVYWLVKGESPFHGRT